MSSDNQAEVTRLKAGIADMLKKVPPSIGAAGMTTTRAYKAAVEKARKCLKNNRATMLSVQQAYTSLLTYWN